MKKLVLLLAVSISLITFVNAQNPQWLHYTYGNDIRAIAEEGNFMWIGTTGGLVKLDKTTGVPTFYNHSNSGLPPDYVRSIAIDGSGSKWIGTIGGGLAKFGEINWIIYNTSNSGLPSDNIRSIVIDESGTKWIGTHFGIVKFNDTSWTSYNVLII